MESSISADLNYPPNPPTAPNRPNPQLPIASITAATQPRFWADDDLARFSAIAIRVAEWTYAGDRMMLAMRQPEGKKLSPTARLVAAAYAWRGWISWPSQLSIAKMLNILPSTVNIAVKELVAAGIMVVTTRHSGKGNRNTDMQYAFVGSVLLGDTLTDPEIITRITRETPTPPPHFPDSRSANPGIFPDSRSANPGIFPDSRSANPGIENPEHPPENPPENHSRIRESRIPDSRFANQTRRDQDDDDDIDPVNHHHQDSGYGTPAEKIEKISDFPPPEFSDFPPPPAGCDPVDYYAALAVAKKRMPDMDPADVAAALYKKAKRDKRDPRDPVLSLKAWLPNRIAECYRARKYKMQASERDKQDREARDNRPWQERNPLYWPDEWRIFYQELRESWRKQTDPPRTPKGDPPEMLKSQVAEIRARYGETC